MHYMILKLSVVALLWLRFVQCWNLLKSKLNSVNLSSQIYITLKFPLLHWHFYWTPSYSQQVVLGECSFYGFRIEITQSPLNAEQTNTLTFFHLSMPSSLKLKLQKIRTKNSANAGVLFDRISHNVLIVKDFCLTQVKNCWWFIKAPVWMPS